jgi:uncharacterized YigZ family protein
MKAYLTIEKEAVCETVIKKSRFIGAVYPVETPEEAALKLSEIKKKYWDATHNCSAMIVGADSAAMRFSDDGEPQGTAGMPMLEVLKQTGLTNVLAIVTRYFGGVLLGAGGLVRAYAGAVADAVNAAQKIEMIPCLVYRLKLPYASFGRLEAMAASGGYGRGNVVFGADVQAELLVPGESAGRFEAEVSEAFLGNVKPDACGETYLAKKVQ